MLSYLRDEVGFRVPKLIDSAQERLEDAGKLEESENGVSLVVDVKATFSGLIINNRVYPGVKVRRGVTSWVTPYKKPIMTHHRSGGGLFSEPSDPIGRVRDAKFKALKKGPEFSKDYMKPDLEGEGSGYVALTAEINDFDAIQKVMDGRYQTLSAGMTSPNLYCSICGGDFIDQGCEHIPGRTYPIKEDGHNRKKSQEVLCYGVTGDLKYIECSFVNNPAAPLAQVIGTDSELYQEVCESVKRDDIKLALLNSSDSIAEVGGITLCDAQGHTVDLLTGRESNMAKAKKKVMVSAQTDLDDLLDDEETTGEPSGQKDETSSDPEPKSTPAHEDEGNKGDEVAPLTDKQFALAHVARSIMDLGKDSYLAEPLPSWDLETEEVEVDGEDHSHRIFLTYDADRGVVVGRTYATLGDTVSHDHVFEVSLSEDSEGPTATFEDTCRSASAGPDHTHKVLVQNPMDGDLNQDELDQLVETLRDAERDKEDGRLTDEQREMLDCSRHGAHHRAFPLASAHHLDAAKTLLTHFNAKADVKSRTCAAIEKASRKLGYDLHKEEPKAPTGKSQDSQTDSEKVGKLKSELRSVRRKLTARDEEIADLTKELTTVQSARSEDLAHNLVLARCVLRKADVRNIKDHESWDSKVQELAARTNESLRDAFNDLRPELDLEIRNRLGGSKHTIIANGEETPLRDKDEKKPVIQEDKSNTGKRKPTRPRTTRESRETVHTQVGRLERDIG